MKASSRFRVMQLLLVGLLSLIPFLPCLATDAAQQLQAIGLDLQQGRLSLPAGRNAMEKIDAYRERFPADNRIVPLAYQWSASMLTAAEQAFHSADYSTAAILLEQIQALVPLTPGLDALQQRFDNNPLSHILTEPTAAGVDNSPMLDTLIVDDFRPFPERIHDELRDPDEPQLVSLADFALDEEKVAARDKGIRVELAPVCQQVIDNNASVQILTEDRVDYGWLTVRLTLCVRRIDPDFRLRLRYLQHDGAPFVRLLPARAEPPEFPEKDQD
jgi:hypothetical protein